MLKNSSKVAMVADCIYILCNRHYFDASLVVYFAAAAWLYIHF